MQNRQIIRTIGIWTGVLCLCGMRAFAAGEVVKESRPNILWVTSEDNSYHWIGYYGNQDAKTPNIDKLAANGIRYRYADSNAAVCAVARNTLILGRYACSTGTHNMRSRYPVPNSFRTYPSFLREAGYYCVNRSKTDYNFKTDDKSHWDESSGKAHWKNRAEGQPFFAVFNTGISHESSLFAKKTDGYRKQGMIPEAPSRDPASVKLPPHYPDTGGYRYIRNFLPQRHRGIRAGYPHGQVGWQSLYKLKQAGELNDVQSAYWAIPQPVEELYHTEQDPWELNNLVNDPKHQKRLAQMRDATLNKMRDIGDTGFVPESMYEGISKDSTVYEYVHNEAFPYEEVLKTALAAGDGGSGVHQKLRAAMQHDHPVMRYWGATGCTIQGDADAMAMNQLRKLLEDPSPSVRVAAAEALYVLGDKQAGFDGLIDILKETDDPVVSLETLNITQALGVMITLSLLVARSVVVAAQEHRKPCNVLFIIPDDLTATALGCYGNKVCRTQNIDVLAAEGRWAKRRTLQPGAAVPS